MSGIYPAPNTLPAGEAIPSPGDEISSTYEGRHLTMREDELIHPKRDSGMVEKGDPVVLCLAGVPGTYGKAVGVAFKTAKVVSDLIALDTEGIWALQVYADNDAGGSAVVPGDELFIDCVTNQAIVAGVGVGGISKRRNVVTQIPFGYALGNLASEGEGVIAVKVHFDPTLLSEQDYYANFESGHLADDARKIIVNDDSGIAGGMNRALALEYTVTRAQSGSAQINGLAIDMFIEAAINDWMPLTIYTGLVADKNIENFFGLSMYFEDFGNNVANFCALDIGYNSPHAPAGRNAFMRLRQHNTVQAESAVMLLEGGSAAAFLLDADTVANLIETGDITSGKTVIRGIRCRVADTVFVLAGYSD